jgi:hypothetical protein
MTASPALTLVPRRSLLAHVAEVESLAELVERLDRTDELTPEAIDELSTELCAAVAGTKAKVDRTCGVLAAFEAAGAAAAIERDRLDVRAKYFARQHARLSEYCLAVLDSSKLDRIDGNTAAIARRKNPGKVLIDDESQIPWDFMRLPEAPPPPDAEPDKKLIATALKVDPLSVPGARWLQEYRLVRS